MIRVSKILLVLTAFFFALLVSFGNITDYLANFSAVQRALSMTDLFPNSTVGYRAILNPVLHHIAYSIIIAFETLTALCCGIGAWKLFNARNEAAQSFNQSKKWAVIGLTLGFLTWHVLFMSIGGEWFGMWMSEMLNKALDTSFHIYMTMLGILIYVVLNDE